MKDRNDPFRPVRSLLLWVPGCWGHYSWSNAWSGVSQLASSPDPAQQTYAALVSLRAVLRTCRVTVSPSNRRSLWWEGRGCGSADELRVTFQLLGWPRPLAVWSRCLSSVACQDALRHTKRKALKNKGTESTWFWASLKPLWLSHTQNCTMWYGTPVECSEWIISKLWYDLT